MFDVCRLGGGMCLMFDDVCRHGGGMRRRRGRMEECLLLRPLTS